MADGRDFPTTPKDYFKRGERNNQHLELSMTKKARQSQVQEIDKYLDQLLAWANSTDLVGGIMLFVGSVAPPGYFLCDGGTFLGTAYPELAAVVGDKFGVHSGDTYFLPNLKGRVPVGMDSSQTEFNAIGKTGGAKTHTHPLSAAGWALMRILSTSGSLYARMKTVASWNATTVVDITGQSTSTSALTNAVELGGATDAGSSLQPFITLNYIIKAEAAPIDGGSSGGGGGPGAVTSVNGQIGDVVLDTDDIPEGANNLYFHEYVHNQPTAATTWTINHNLGYKPEVGVYSPGSVQLTAEVMHASDNQTIISFVAANAGYARLT